MASGQIIVKFCPTADNHADLMTKSLPEDVYVKDASAIMGNHSYPAKQQKPTLRLRTFDVEAAYLKGKFQESEVHHVRPPIGYRTFARGNIPIVWRLKAPLYLSLIHI